MADYPEAIDYFVDPRRVFINQNTHEMIVLHATGGAATQTAQQLGDYFRTNSLLTSVHYGIDRNGTVAQYVRERDGAAGNCCLESGSDPFWHSYLTRYSNLNLCSLSIEHVNDATNSLPLTDAQKAASFKLIASLSKKYTIAFDHIKPHASLAPGSRARCPGPLFPWDELRAYLSAQTGEDPMLTITDPFAALFFKEVAPDRWHCPSKNLDIVYGILGFYRRTNGVLRLPLTGEFSIVPEVTAQVFEGGIELAPIL